MPLVAALDSVPGTRALLGLFESVCTGAADGYARIAGRPAMTLLHLGPGFANGIPQGAAPFACPGVALRPSRRYMPRRRPECPYHQGNRHVLVLQNTHCRKRGAGHTPFPSGGKVLVTGAQPTFGSTRGTVLFWFSRTEPAVRQEARTSFPCGKQQAGRPARAFPEGRAARRPTADRRGTSRA
jgi:hypothetical protein